MLECTFETHIGVTITCDMQKMLLLAVQLIVFRCGCITINLVLIRFVYLYVHF